MIYNFGINCVVVLRCTSRTCTLVVLYGYELTITLTLVHTIPTRTHLPSCTGLLKISQGYR